jgi:hypothetical protein
LLLFLGQRECTCILLKEIGDACNIMVIIMTNLMMMMMMMIMMMMIWTIMMMTIIISFSSHLWAMIILARQKSTLPKKVSWKMVCSLLCESLKLGLSFKIICSVLY